MRKLVSLGLLALIFSLLSSDLLASNIDACKDFKKAGKGLYGLCVAWHRADEKNKGKIAKKFELIAGYPFPGIPEPEPEPDFLCPCWDTLAETDVGKDAPAYICVYDNTELSALGDVVIFKDVGSFGFFQGFAVNTGQCRYDDFYVHEDGVVEVFAEDIILGLSVDEELECRMDIREIGDAFFVQETVQPCMELNDSE